MRNRTLPGTLNSQLPEDLPRESDIDIVTCEYPPTVGGVADYTRLVAQGLDRNGYSVRVWAPVDKTHPEAVDLATGKVLRSLGRFGLKHIFESERLMGSPKGKCLLLQWEPVGFGLRSINLPFCLWIASRALRGTRLLVMFHETFVPFKKRSPGRFLVGLLQRLMSFVLVNSAQSVFASNESGARALQRFCLGPGKIQELPVFSNIEEDSGKAEFSDSMRERFTSPGDILVGHFGRAMAGTQALMQAPLVRLMRKNSRVRVLFIGECGVPYRSALIAENPELADRVFATKVCSPTRVAGFISACDFLFQPYPGGLTTKRSSTMAALGQGRCVASNAGVDTESLWKSCESIRLIGKTDAGEIADELNEMTGSAAELKTKGLAASQFYEDRFCVQKTLNVILSHLQRTDREQVSRLGSRHLSAG